LSLSKETQKENETLKKEIEYAESVIPDIPEGGALVQQVTYVEETMRQAIHTFLTVSGEKKGGELIPRITIFQADTKRTITKLREQNEQLQANIPKNDRRNKKSKRSTSGNFM